MSRWTRFVGGACAAALVAAVSAPAAARGVTTQAAFTGEGEPGKSAAVKLALKKALEEAVGDFLRGQRHVRNHDTILERVMADPTPFINSWKVKSAEYLEGTWTVEVAAEVSTDKFTDEWKLTYCLVNSPRLMVVVAEERDGTAQTLRVVQAGIERHFLKKGFRLVDKSQFTDVKEARLKEAALADDLATAASVARDFGCELLVVGHARTDKGRTEDVAGFKFQFYSAQAVVKVIQTDSAALVASERATARAGSRDAPTAADKALEQLASQIAARLWSTSVKNWDRMIGSGGYRCELHITGITAPAVIDLESELKELEGVREVRLRSMRAGTAHFDLLSTHSAKELFALIVKKKAVKNLEVTGITQNVIQARWTKETL